MVRAGRGRTGEELIPRCLLLQLLAFFVVASQIVQRRAITAGKTLILDSSHFKVRLKAFASSPISKISPIDVSRNLGTLQGSSHSGRTMRAFQVNVVLMWLCVRENGLLAMLVQLLRRALSLSRPPYVNSVRWRTERPVQKASFSSWRRGVERISHRIGYRRKQRLIIRLYIWPPNPTIKISGLSRSTARRIALHLNAGVNMGYNDTPGAS